MPFGRRNICAMYYLPIPPWRLTSERTRWPSFLIRRGSSALRISSSIAPPPHSGKNHHPSVNNNMPFFDANGADTYYELAGASASPALVFSNSLGTNFKMWDAQTTALGSEFKILRYDTRGHGSSGVTKGPYTISQ